MGMEVRHMADATQADRGWVQYPLRLRPELKRRLEARARAEERSLRWVLEQAAEAYLRAGCAGEMPAGPGSGEGGER